MCIATLAPTKKPNSQKSQKHSRSAISDISKAVNRNSAPSLCCPTWGHLSDADSRRPEDKKWHWLCRKRAKSHRKIGAQSGELLFCLPPSRLDIFRKTPNDKLMNVCGALIVITSCWITNVTVKILCQLTNNSKLFRTTSVILLKS